MNPRKKFRVRPKLADSDDGDREGGPIGSSSPNQPKRPPTKKKAGQPPHSFDVDDEDTVVVTKKPKKRSIASAAGSKLYNYSPRLCLEPTQPALVLAAAHEKPDCILGCSSYPDHVDSLSRIPLLPCALHLLQPTGTGHLGSSLSACDPSPLLVAGCFLCAASPPPTRTGASDYSEKALEDLRKATLGAAPWYERVDTSYGSDGSAGGQDDERGEIKSKQEIDRIKALRRQAQKGGSSEGQAFTSKAVQFAEDTGNPCQQNPPPSFISLKGPLRDRPQVKLPTGKLLEPGENLADSGDLYTDHQASHVPHCPAGSSDEENFAQFERNQIRKTGLGSGSLPQARPNQAAAQAESFPHLFSRLTGQITVMKDRAGHRSSSEQEANAQHTSAVMALAESQKQLATVRSQIEFYRALSDWVDDLGQCYEAKVPLLQVHAGQLLLAKRTVI
eukprot:gene6627-1182_t